MLLTINVIKSFNKNKTIKGCVSIAWISKQNRKNFSLNNFKMANSNQSIYNDMIGKHLLTLQDYSEAQIEVLLWSALDLKKITKETKSKDLTQLLKGLSIAAIFQKRSTRTRFAFEAGAHLLGAHVIFCNKEDIHLGVNETPRDTATVMSSLADAITGRVFEHSMLEELTKYSSCPVINALSDLHHPLQALADLMTIYEHFGHLKGLKIAWIGDGNNVLHSLLIVGTKMKMNVSIATPVKYEPDTNIINYCMDLSRKNGTTITLTNKPEVAIQDADVIVTDTWISMGQESEKKERLVSFAGYQINLDLLKNAKKDWIFLHCLPRKQEEVDDEVFYHSQSLVFPEAENRKWTTMSVLLHALRGYQPTEITSRPNF